jgi:hypothetical protein
MSAKGTESVLTRAMSDTAFADQLFSDPEKALAGFDLTTEEFSWLKTISRAEVDQYSKASLEERRSFLGGNHNESASTAGLESVFTRAMSDTAFADQLFSNPEKALAGFDLTAEEITWLKTISRAEVDQYSKASLEERRSFLGGNHNESVLTVC